MSSIVSLVLMAVVLVAAHGVLLLAWERWFRSRTAVRGVANAAVQEGVWRAIARLRRLVAGGDASGRSAGEAAGGSGAGEEPAWGEVFAELADQAVEAQESLERKLRTAETRLAEQSELLAAQIAAARTDVLTGLANRRAFDDELAVRMDEVRQRGGELCVVLLDIDHFKQLNDQWGHAVGDLALKRVAAVLSRTFRRGDAVARYGGEEFGIILPETGAVRAAEVAERARQAVAQHPLVFDGREIGLTVSAGFAQADDCEHARSLVRRADEALYAAKAAGRNCCGWHDGCGVQRLGMAAGVGADASARSAAGEAMEVAAAAEGLAEGAASDGAVAERTEVALTELCEEVRRRLEQLNAPHPARDRRRV